MLALALSWGCKKKAPAEPPPPPPPPEEIQPEPEKEPAPEAVIPPISPLQKTESAAKAPQADPARPPDSFYFGTMSLQKGEYAQAAQFFESFIGANPDSALRDQALFYLGLSHALADASYASLRRAEAAFKMLIAEFPESVYRSPAELILRLQAQIKKLSVTAAERKEKIEKLSEELQMLKEIDLQRRRTRPQE